MRVTHACSRGANTILKPTAGFESCAKIQRDQPRLREFLLAYLSMTAQCHATDTRPRAWGPSSTPSGPASLGASFIICRLCVCTAPAAAF